VTPCAQRSSAIPSAWSVWSDEVHVISELWSVWQKTIYLNAIEGSAFNPDSGLTEWVVRLTNIFTYLITVYCKRNSKDIYVDQKLNLKLTKTKFLCKRVIWLLWLGWRKWERNFNVARKSSQSAKSSKSKRSVYFNPLPKSIKHPLIQKSIKHNFHL
jgi:hypothetical protein